MRWVAADLAQRASKTTQSLLTSLAPAGVDAAIWSAWLAGANTPFPEKPVKNVGRHGVAGPDPHEATPTVDRQREKLRSLEAQMERERRRLV